MFALALSGGGTKGYAELGVLKFLHEKGLIPSRISGSSVGAMVGAFYSYYRDVDILIDKALKININTILDPNFSLKGNSLSRGEKLKKFLTKLLPKRFSDLSIPLIVTATQIKPVQNIPISSGNLIKAVLASSAYPIVYPPVKIGNKYYIDGGLTSPLPLYVFDKSLKIIAVNIFDKKFVGIKNIPTYIEELFFIPQKRIYDLEKKDRKVFEIKPSISVKHSFDFSNKELLLKAGYNAARRSYRQIQEFLNE